MNYPDAESLNFLLINGPLMGMLGKREPGLYGGETLGEIEAWIINKAQEVGVEINCFQSESEGEILRFIIENADTAEGIIINPGAYSHYSYAIRDALNMVACPVVEVHMTNIYRREDFRTKTVTAEVCDGLITGLGKYGYYSALMYLLGMLRE